MTGREFRMARNQLGESLRGLAALLGVDFKTIDRWERDVYPVPLMAALAMCWLAHEQDVTIKALAPWMQADNGDREDERVNAAATHAYVMAHNQEDDDGG